MSTEYSRSVDDWSDSRWNHIAVDIMYDYYLNSRAAKKEAKDLNMSIEDYARETANGNYPMMLYCYPLYGRPDDKTIIKICKETPCGVVEDTDTDEYFLTLCGGGMDLSQSIAMAYIIAEGHVPYSLAVEVSKQPELSVHGSRWLKVARHIKKQLKQEKHSIDSEIRGWNGSIKEFNKRQEGRRKKKEEP